MCWRVLSPPLFFWQLLLDRFVFRGLKLRRISGYSPGLHLKSLRCPEIVASDACLLPQKTSTDSFVEENMGLGLRSGRYGVLSSSRVQMDLNRPLSAFLSVRMRRVLWDR